MFKKIFNLLLKKSFVLLMEKWLQGCSPCSIHAKFLFLFIFLAFFDRRKSCKSLGVRARLQWGFFQSWVAMTPGPYASVFRLRILPNEFSGAHLFSTTALISSNVHDCKTSLFSVRAGHRIPRASNISASTTLAC